MGDWQCKGAPCRRAAVQGSDSQDSVGAGDSELGEEDTSTVK